MTGVRDSRFIVCLIFLFLQDEMLNNFVLFAIIIIHRKYLEI